MKIVKSDHFKPAIKARKERNLKSFNLHDRENLNLTLTIGTQKA